MAYDNIETGRVKETAIGSAGDLRVTLTDIPEGEISDCTAHQPMGLQSRPRDNKADAVYAANGDVCEILNLQDCSAQKALSQRAGAGVCAKGETRLFSVGDNPNGILLKDNAFKLGTNANDAMLKGTTYRNAETALNTAIKTAYAALPAVATNPATTMALVNAIRLMLLNLGAGAYTDFENGANNYLSTLTKVE